METLYSKPSQNSLRVPQLQHGPPLPGASVVLMWAGRGPLLASG